MARKTHKEYSKQILDKHGDIYKYHSEYELGSVKIKVEHKICGYVWDILPPNLYRGSSSCPQCSGKHRRSPEEFREYVKEITDGEFSSIEDFKGNRYMTTFKHNPCGYTFRAMSQIAEREELGCRNCSNMLIHDKERVESLLEDKFGTEYILISDEVLNNRHPITVKHMICGEIFDTRSTDIIHSSKQCPKCAPSGSNGERRIDKHLKSLGLGFAREFSFFDCRYINELRFDFVIYDNKGEIDFLVEFDGKQHYESVEFFGGEEGFRLTKLRDGIKNTYCYNKNIKLLRIPYWDEDDIKTILDSYMSINRKVA